MLAVKYMEILCGTSVFQNMSGRELSSHLSELIVSFSSSAAEAIALNDAANYEIPDALLNAMLPSCGNSDPYLMLINYNKDKQKESGLNVDRIDAQHEKNLIISKSVNEMLMNVNIVSMVKCGIARCIVCVMIIGR